MFAAALALAAFGIIPSVSDTAAAGSTTLVISEFQVAGSGTKPAADEFIELHNVGTASVDLSGKRVVYRSAAGSSDKTLRSWASSVVIPAGGFYLLANPVGYSASVVADSGLGSGLVNGELAAAGGGLAIRSGAEDTGTIVDSVGYGTATNAFVETAATAAPAATASHQRKASQCQDTNDNSADFQGQAPSAPTNSTSADVPCVAPTPTATPEPTPEVTPEPTPEVTPEPSFRWTGSTVVQPSVNRVTGGARAKLTFSLGGDYGLDILRPGWPRSQRYTCGTNHDFIEVSQWRTRPFGSAGLSYDSRTKVYTYAWSTRVEWSRPGLSCRQFQLRLKGDPHTYTVDIKFRPIRGRAS